MDIVTHALIGGVVASSFAETAPLSAAAFALGSALPDLDAFSRVLGRYAFMRAHQTWTHALPVLALLGFAGTAANGFAFHDHLLYDPWWPAALALGMIVHVLMDYSNTYGVALLLPFSRKRRSLEWVLFIDAGVLAITAAAGACLGWTYYRYGYFGSVIGATYAGVLAAYWLFRGLLRRHAAKWAPEGTLALVPSAWWPWIYLGCAPAENGILTFTLNGLTGRIWDEAHIRTHDAPYLTLLETLPEYRLMKQLSPAYHVVEARTEGGITRLRVRDLRHRNFDVKFGELELALSSTGELLEKTFHA